jgi:hypothetical protein
MPILAQTFEPTPPTLTVRLLPNQSVRLAWPKAASGFALEQTDRLSPSPAWQRAAEVPQIETEESVVIVAAGTGSRFFRLRQEEVVALTTITETSPVDGETGVAVTRETIVYLSSPLAANAVLTSDHFYAGFGGRRLLALVELSNQRDKATLFYQEPMPGSTRVVAVFDGTGLTDAQGRPLDADGDGQAGGAHIIAFDTLSLTPVAGTAVIGRVFASELQPGPDTGANAVNKPLAGVTITVDGMEQTLRTVTDAMGNFKLEPVPPGRFFVHIDGRTVRDEAAGIRYPDLAYYPFVGKAWDAVAGRTENKAGGTGEIYLPLIKPGTLQPVSLEQDSTITFPQEVIATNPALAGVTITVPANSLFSDNGTRGGKVGIAAVPPDRLPGPLPAGLELPIVITVQTDGALNFDRPAPICFPNLPDPVLKTPLPAGSRQALISFNHDKGVWEAVGSMTVSADGKFICTDTGVGVLQPGWHGVGPTPDDPPPCDKLCCDGGGDDGPISAVAGRVGKAGPKPKRCKPKPKCKESEVACLKRAADKREVCRRKAMYAFEDCSRTNGRGTSCHAATLDKAICDAGFALCWRIADDLRFPCDVEYLIDIAKCKPCSAVNLRPAKSGLDDDPADQIVAKLEEINALLAPFIGLDPDIPTEVRLRVLGLLSEADALAGGDAGQFLRQYLTAREVEVAAFEADYGEEIGNAPPYPILYAAQIRRSNGTLTLRGETAPFGQYDLFVTRDGELSYVTFYDPLTRRYGAVFPRLRPEAPHRLPRFILAPLDATLSDIDGDGLADAVEFVYGTDETKPDSDGDGIFDGAEVDQGTNPLDGRPVQTGIIATAKTIGPAVDVWAGNDLVVTAERTAGVSVFNSYQGMNPVLVAHVPRPGNAQRVAASDNRLAVAAGDAGLVIIDLTTPAEARVVQHLPLGNVTLVVAAGGVA